MIAADIDSDRNRLAAGMWRISFSYQISRLKKDKIGQPRMSRMKRMEEKMRLDRARRLH
jgi:hypothetical protein